MQSHGEPLTSRYFEMLAAIRHFLCHPMMCIIRHCKGYELCDRPAILFAPQVHETPLYASLWLIGTFVQLGWDVHALDQMIKVMI